MKHDKITVLDPSGKRFQVSRRKLSQSDGGTAKPGQVAIAVAGVAKKNQPTTLFEGRASSPEYAVKLAVDKLGKITGNRSDGTVFYAKAGWCRLEWLENFGEARCNELPTVLLPRSFRIVTTGTNR